MFAAHGVIEEYLAYDHMYVKVLCSSQNTICRKIGFDVRVTGKS